MDTTGTPSDSNAYQGASSMPVNSDAGRQPKSAGVINPMAAAMVAAAAAAQKSSIESASSLNTNKVLFSTPGGQSSGVPPRPVATQHAPFALTPHLLALLGVGLHPSTISMPATTPAGQVQSHHHVARSAHTATVSMAAASIAAGHVTPSASSGAIGNAMLTNNVQHWKLDQLGKYTSSLIRLVWCRMITLGRRTIG